MEDETPTSLLEQQLVFSIQESLQNHLISNATFLAERLLSERDSEQTRSLLADCYLAENKPHKVVHVLQNCHSGANRYKYALACMKLCKYKEAQAALLPDSLHVQGSSLGAQIPTGSAQKYLFQHTQGVGGAQGGSAIGGGAPGGVGGVSGGAPGVPQQDQMPNGAFGWYLLGQVCEKQYRTNEAREYYSRALDLNPALWSAFEKLCKMGETSLIPSKVFNDSKYRAYIAQHADAAAFQAPTSASTTASSVQSMKGAVHGYNFEDSSSFQATPPHVQHHAGVPGAQHRKAPSQGGQQQPQQQQQQQAQQQQQPQQPQQQSNFSNITHLLQQQQQVGGGGLSNSFVAAGGQQQQQQQQQQSNQQQQQASVYSTPGLSNSGKKVPNVQASILPRQNTNARGLMHLLDTLGQPFYQMCQYHCQEAIELYKALPPRHAASAWALACVGRCYFETVQYARAEEYFQAALKSEPHRLEGLEYYSSTLWHLKKPVELTYLAHQMLEKSLYAPESWIAVGNCFSLQKEHENAIKFFNRALQLNQNSAYAHQLCGSEYMCNEDFGRAKKCFENSLNIDQRHYQSWWGLGHIFYKQEKYDKAVEHFSRAIQINQRNPVLYSFLGMTLLAKREYSESLKYFERAEQLDPTNGLNRYQKANALVRLERYIDALHELAKLHAQMPKESPILVLMGRIYKKLGNIKDAQKYLELALDVDHKDTQRIKALIDSLHSQSNEFAEEVDL